jgi:hypothetical protein
MNNQQQLGFDNLLNSADRINTARIFERKTSHLPDMMEEGLCYYRAMIADHHAAMIDGDIDEAMRLREEAHNLATRLNDGEPGILADDDAPGCVLERETAAEAGAVPLWGQQGDFVVTVGAMRVRVEMDGMFGISTLYSTWPGFSAHAIDTDRPFLSETGYRSFLGIHADYVPGLTPESFVQGVLAEYVATTLKGRLLNIGPRFA